MKKVFAAGIALAVLMGSQTVMAAPDNSPTVQSVASDFVYTAKAKEALNYINEVRQKAGLGQVTLNPFITKAAQNHADYIATNSYYEHSERSGDPGFTGKSIEDRLSSVGYPTSGGVVGWEDLSFHTSNVKEAIDAFIDAAYHRIPLLQPTLKEIGVGVSGTNVAIDMVADGNSSETAVYPYDKQTDVRTWFRGFENPNPLSKFGVSTSGYIISYTNSGALVENNNTNGTITDSKGTSIPFFSEITDGYLFMYPKSELKSGETYTVSVELKPDFGRYEGQTLNKMWSFTTATSDTPAPVDQQPTPEPAHQTQYSSKNIGIKINGNYVDINPKATMVGSSTFIPLRGVFEAIGAKVTWIGETRSILIEKGTKTIKLTLDSKDAVIDGEKVKLVMAPFSSKEGSSYVPLRFASEALGAVVRWDSANWTAIIDTNN